MSRGQLINALAGIGYKANDVEVDFHNEKVWLDIVEAGIESSNVMRVSCL